MGDARRIGKFHISSHFIDNDPAAVLATLDGCIVVRAEMLWHLDVIEYVAVAPDFELVEPGETTPIYDALIVGGKREWRRSS